MASSNDKTFISEEEFDRLVASGQVLPANQTQPIIPGVDRRPAGAPPAPVRFNAIDNFQSALLPSFLGTDADLLKAGSTPPGVPSTRLMPIMPSGISNANSAIQSHTQNILETANEAQSTATTANTTANSAQSTATQALAQSFQGAWNAGITYAVGASVDSGGSIYLCVVSNINHMPPNAGFWTPLSSTTSYAGVWSSAVAYTIGQIVSVSTSLYFALQNSTNENPATSPTFWQLLTGASVYLGQWSSSTTYAVGQTVSYTDGNFYIAIASSLNQTPAPTGSSFWVLLGTSNALIGTWNSGTTYTAGMEVSYAPSGGATNYYIALQSNTNQTPAAATTAYWYLIVNNTAIASATSYRPTTNPLTATDAGSSVTITIASFTMNVAGVGAVSVNGGSLTGLSYATLYYVFYADPTISGGAVTYQETTTKTNAISSGVDFFVGSILTPLATAPDTLGNNDGGVGAQYGGAGNLWATAVTAVSGWTNVANAVDQNTTTAATNTSSSPTILTVSGFNGIAPVYTSLVLNVRTAGTGMVSALWELQYSLNGGSTWTTIFTKTNTNWGPQVDQVTLSVSQLLSQVQVRLNPVSTSSGTASFYEAWIVASF
jgi:hypothetical protein